MSDRADRRRVRRTRRVLWANRCSNVGGPWFNQGMDGVIDRLEQLQADFAAAVVDALPQIADLPDAEVMRLLNASGRVLRSNDALQVAATVQVRERSEGLRGERMTTSHGCDRPADLLQMVLRTDARSAARLVKAAGLTAQVRGITDGELLPSRYDELRKALAEATIGLDGFLAATAPLEASRGRVAPEALVEADRQIASFARRRVQGRDADGEGAPAPDAPAPTPAELAQFAQVLAAYLDPDGAEPTDDAASRARGLWIGRLRDGRVPLRGELLPEVAAQLARLTDSLLNPRVQRVLAPQGVHAAGGATHTDNGVALCWHHHRTLHLSEWQVRMRGGVPEIRGPSWWDPGREWHRAGRRRARVRSSPAASCG